MKNAPWPYRRLDELGTKRRPILKAGPFGSAVTKGSYVESGYKIYGQQEVVSGNPYATNYRIPPATFEKMKSCAVLPGDILITMMGTVGKLLVVPQNAEPGIINPRLMRISVDTAIADPFFVVSFLGCQKVQQLLERRAHGGTMPGLNADALGSIRIPLPPLPEQRKIAKILRTWDEAIEKLAALRAAKVRRHCALTHSLVFGTRQLDQFHTTDPAAPYRWFALPASWRCQAIGELAKEISERNEEARQYEVLSCSKYAGFVRSLEYFKKQVFSADLTGYKKIWRGDFGFPSNHVEEGSIGLQNLVDIGVVSPIYTVFRFVPEKVDADYAFAVLKTGLYRHIFEVSTSASVDRRGSLRWSEFSKLPFPVPPLAEQRAIAEVLRTAQAELDAQGAALETLTRQKRSLMQKLLTGEWRVNA